MEFKDAFSAERRPGANHPDRPREGNVATRLIGLVEHADFFMSKDGKPFARVAVDGHLETYLLRSSAFTRLLQKTFFESEGKAVSGTALRDALGVLEARAQFEGDQRTTYIRVGGDDDVIYLDLGTHHWNAVRIDSDGWSIVDKVPIPFWRSPGMRPLPEPKREGQLDTFRKFLNLDDESAWQLMLAWLVAALRPVGPCPILVLIGQAGSAKSTTAELLRRTIDPALPALRSLPRDERDLMIAANNNWILALDNLSGMSAVSSDMLCRLSTGGGYATRALYTNDEEILFCAQRPIILTSIDEVATREDLLDRAIVLPLPPIADDQRLDERTLWRNFSSVQPYLLGNLLDAVSEALRNYQSIQLTRRPRLADFAQWVSAAEPALELPNGAMINAFTANRASAIEAGIDADVVARAVIAFTKNRAEWFGTASELLDELTEATPDRTTRQRSWPKNPSQLSNRLRRLTTILEQRELSVTFAREGHGRSRIIHIRNAQQPVLGVRRVRPVRNRAVKLPPVGAADGADSEFKPFWRRLLMWKSRG